ncbi:MAG: hypothetical protein JOZ29_17380 [Deltaproteobacteria bacterium]|nr:hypothetical protein [Deltaproteobacteria bacterium]MBV8454024.1 hypothetical protein [Deltaproteobacteria bacterium]
MHEPGGHRIVCVRVYLSRFDYDSVRVELYADVTVGIELVRVRMEGSEAAVGPVNG